MQHSAEQDEKELDDPYILIKCNGTNSPLAYIHLPSIDDNNIDQKRRVEDALGSIFRYMQDRSLFESSLMNLLTTGNLSDIETKVIAAASVLGKMWMMNPDQEVIIKPSEVFQRMR